MRNDLKHGSDQRLKFIRVSRWDGRILTTQNLFIEHVHVGCSEGGHKAAHFIEQTAKRPNVAFIVVRLIFPNFGARIVRSTGLSK